MVFEFASDLSRFFNSGGGVSAAGGSGSGVAAATLAGRTVGQTDLDPPARLVIAATDTTCLLLTVRGELVEVSVP